MGKGSEGDSDWVTKTPLRLEAESDSEYNNYSFRPRKRKVIFSSEADKYSLRPRKIKDRFSLGADDEKNHRFKGLKFNKTLRLRAETKNYKPKVPRDDDLLKTFIPRTPKCATAERARELSGEREKLDEPSGCGFQQPCTSIGRHSEMDGHNIIGDQERPLLRSCKKALRFDDPIVRAVNRPVYEIQIADNLPCSQTFSEDPSSSKKFSRCVQVYHRRHNKFKKVQPFFEWHSKPVQVYHRRFKKNRRHSKCKTVKPFFQERRNKKRKASVLTEGIKDSPGKDASIHKKPRRQVPSSEGGPIVKHSKNSQVHRKKQDALAPINETPSDKDRMILRTKVILDEETIRELEFLMEKPEHEGCKSEKCDERWEKERELFCGRVISFISRMHHIQGDRQFSQWKGSIVDSVAGVFLTQNVSDNLSSSAYMSLAAQYPCYEVRFTSTFQNNIECSDTESRDGVDICHPSTSAENVTKTVQESGLMSERTTENLLSCRSRNGNEKTKLEKSSEGSANQGIHRRTNTNVGKREKEEILNEQAEPVLRRKNKNADLKSEAIKWENMRKSSAFVNRKERGANTVDAIDWHAVRAATADEIAKAIMQRGMDKKLALRIKNFINRVILEQGNVDLEWLREVQPEKAKEYLLSIYGLGMKSVECIRLLSLQHQAFPVDTNVGRVLVRLGWVPIQPLPRGQDMHLLKMYPDAKDVHKYLWPRLCTLDHLTLYEFHHQLITFGKVFCTKSSPNCNACPMKAECRHFASAFTSARVPLTGPREKSSANIDTALAPVDSAFSADSSSAPAQANHVSSFAEASNSEHLMGDHQNELITYPVLECNGETDLEDYCASDIPMITFDREAFRENLLSYLDEHDLSIKDIDLSNALVIATQEAPLPKWKNIGRLRTEHQVYELPDSHPLLEGLDKREQEDPCPYLLAIRTPGNAASEEPTKEKCQSCNSGETLKKVEKCEYCNCDETQNKVAPLNMDPGGNNQTVQGTLLIPCRTANRGRFPLNGTYFQVNEVFADEDSSRQPIEVPRAWIWNLRRKTLYCGTSIRAIFRGMSTKEVQNCFWRGYVCLRGFNPKTRKPGPLPLDLHRPISKSGKSKGEARLSSEDQRE
ncbi:protein ROS1A-like [Lycium barbarum]|uniref:protein ROS1A-like n=1 Tax=Lycium barbarum TaxID=112863 RepID=UPI00293F53BE|nr:protein ROS1A-like [Lycium barbarum]XP_060185107.1 protein ROS1A-like [Lycium barbarum]